MFLTLLGGSLVLGAGLLAAASSSDGGLVASRTAALSIGWLLILASAIGLRDLRHGGLGEVGALAVAFVSGVTVLYLSYFEWGEGLEAPIRHAAAEVLPARVSHDEVITLASVQAATPVAPIEAAKKKPLLVAKPVDDPCASLAGLESLQCNRCADKLGVAWIVCQERARLEYCEGATAEEALCPSAIPSATSHTPPA